MHPFDSQECSSRNTFEASGIRLRSDQFKPDYYNTSSKAFKDMAREKEYLFWVLIKATGQDEAIRGKSLFIFAQVALTKTTNLCNILNKRFI